MDRLKNIANSCQRLVPPSGGRGFLLLIAITLLLASTRYASAQNTGASPYLNSWHTYRVLIGNSSNNYRWDMVNLANTADTINLANKSGDIASYVNAALAGTNNDISVYFGDANGFTVGQTWELLYREYSPSAPGNCVAARKFTITIEANEFFISLAANDAVCKSESGAVHNWDDVDNENFNTIFQYTVTLHKAANHTLTGWAFDGVVSLSPVNHSFVSYTISVDAAEQGTATLVDTPTALDGAFRVVASPSSLNPATTTSFPVIVTVTVSGLLHNGFAATLNLTGGQATSGSTNAILTDDNTDRPNVLRDGVSDALLQDRAQVITVNPLPATNNILPGAGETMPVTSSSAAYPLQNSTHNYAVVMSDVTDLPNTTPDWYIQTSAGVPVAASDYDLVQSSSATADTATISFKMATGSYVLYFRETNDLNCSAVRPFPFTLQDPFDVDIAEATDDCADIDGLVNNTPAVATNDTVYYTVGFASGFTYSADWKFDINLSCADFATTLTVFDVSVTGGTATSLGANSWRVNVANSTATPVTSVSVRVIYRGLFASAHTIAAGLVNISGSFKEVDKDGTNSTDNIIYPIPQAGILAGVD